MSCNQTNFEKVVAFCRQKSDSICDGRKKNKNQEQENKNMNAKNRIEIKLGRNAENQADEIARENNGAIKNWRSATASTANGRTGRIQTHNLGRYSSRCQYTHYEYSPTMTSWGIVLADGIELAGRIGKQGFRLTAPKGFVFSSDALGAKLQSRDGKRDYHFSSDEVLAENAMRGMMQRARANWSRQAEARKSEAQAKRDAKIYEQEIASVRVTLDDSRRAGNCIEGSLTYAEQRLHISRDEILGAGYLFSVPAEKLLATNGHDGVKRAVRAAWLRETAVQI